MECSCVIVALSAKAACGAGGAAVTQEESYAVLQTRQSGKVSIVPSEGGGVAMLSPVGQTVVLHHV